MYVNLDKPLKPEGLCEKTPRSKTYIAGIFQRCELTVGYAISSKKEECVVTVKTTDKKIGTWRLNNKITQVTIIQVGNEPLTFYKNEVITCEFVIGNTVQIHQILVEIREENMYTLRQYFSQDTDLATAFRDETLGSIRDFSYFLT